MEAHKTIEIRTVYNKPFFVNEILAAIRPDVLTPQMFDQMVIESRPYHLDTMLTAMARQIDISGMVPFLLGAYEDPQAALEVLMNLGHIELMKINQLDREMQAEIFETIKGGSGTTLRALMVLYECHREIVGHLRQVRQESPLAMAARQGAEDALVTLCKTPEKLASPMFDEVISLSDRICLLQGSPQICFPRRIFDGAVVEVWQFFFLPKLHDVFMPRPFETHTIGNLLERLTPHVYNRKYSDDDRFDPTKPAEFIGLLGKVGAALPRLIVKQVKKNRQIKELVMREHEIAAALYELFSH